MQADVNHFLNQETHIPVLLKEMIGFLKPCGGQLYVDATFGGGGYSKEILKTENCRVLALDRDPEAKLRAQSFLEMYPGRFQFIESNFGQLKAILDEMIFSGIVFDFGVSSYQLEEGERGFSFQIEGPLDMRMSQNGITAEEVVNTFSQKDLEEIIRVYGEESLARRISYAIIKERKRRFLRTTFDLANIVRSVVPRSKMIDPATKTFQAIRIFINDELREIQEALKAIADLVIKNKILNLSVITVSFHSLEDRIVKNWFRGYGLNSEIYSKINWQAESRVIVPSSQELKENPRSRSAKLRSMKLSFVGNTK